MNSSYYQNQIVRLEREIADLHSKIAEESKKEINQQRYIESIHRSTNSNTSLSSLQSKQRQINTHNNNILNAKKRIAEIYQNISRKSGELGRVRQLFSKATETEQKKIQTEQSNFQKKLRTEIESHKQKLNFLVHQNYSQEINQASEQENKDFDFFISHATEDKEDVVKELANALKNKGFKVWYDNFEITYGDSLRTKIDEGLVKSRYGIVIISPNFIRKKTWTEYELNGMVAREMNGHKVILPIWHKVTKDEVLQFSPSLADKLALNTATHSIGEIVEELSKFQTISG